MTNESLTPINPATGEATDSIPITSAEEVKNAIERSRQAFNKWRFTSVQERKELLLKTAEALDSQAESIGRTITSEMGRVLAESVPEVTKSAAFFRYFAEIADSALEPKELNLAGLTLPQKRSKVLYEPRGVAAIIKPWNAPVQQIVWAVAPALIAGCTVIIKPSEFTPRSAMRLQEAFDAAGFPPDVVITLPGDGTTGRALVEGDIDIVAFTGSIATGRKVAEIMGRKIRKCVLELSGKDALIVDENVRNLDLVAAGIVYGAFSNTGHWCSSVERVFLPSSIAEALMQRIVESTKNLRVGPGDQTGVDVGPIANRKQYDIVTSIVDDAVAQGAHALCGGPMSIPGHERGLFFAPMILTDVPDEARLTTENIFGPVVAIYKYDDLDDAIRQANSSNYGLGLSVWTDSNEFGDYVAKRSDTGMVWINEPLQSIAACPWSVYKDSGIGVELGESGVREFTFEKVVQSQFEENSGPRAWYFPYK
jgi:succinate-semialdehyde dehydrogenase/glutarate-semialdehyde dehydrogenase